MTVKELLSRIDSEELTEWRAYDRVDPFGGVRGDHQSAVVAATLANIHRDRKKQAKPFDILDFMPDFLARFKGKKQQSLEEMKSILMDLTEKTSGKSWKEKK